jgi:superfamily II DNA or RNA helicase
MDEIDNHLYNIKLRLKNKIQSIDIDTSDNKVLAIPFEYYVAIELSRDKKILFFQNDFITPEEREEIGLPKRDLGIDFTDKKKAIGQVKLYKGSIHRNDISNFLSHQVSMINGIPTIKWPELILCRSAESSLSKNIDKARFSDYPYDTTKFRNFLKNLQIESQEEKCEEKKEIITIKLKPIFDLLMTSTKNIVLSIPKSEDKIIINFLKRNKDVKSIIYVFNEISEMQYDEKIREMEKNKPVIQLHKSFKIDEANKYDKVFITDAHRIHPQHIYDNSVPFSEKSYIDEMRKFIEKNTKCVLLSHHIQKIPNCDYHRETLRDFITKGLCASYEVSICTFEVKPSIETIVDWISRQLPNNCLVTSHTKEEGETFTQKMNEILPHSTFYFDSESKNDYNELLTKFKNGEIRFLCSPLLLVESFYAPICDSVLFLRPSSRQMYLTSFINRSLLPHPSKVYAKVFLPTYTGNEKDMCDIIDILATYDEKVERKKIETSTMISLVRNIDRDSPESDTEGENNSISNQSVWKFIKDTKTDDDHLSYILDYEDKNGVLPEAYEWLENLKSYIHEKCEIHIKKYTNDFEGEKDCLKKALNQVRFQIFKDDKIILRKLRRSKCFVIWLLSVLEKTPNVEQLECITAIICHRKNSFIQGPGGTGKSYIIDCIRNICDILSIPLILLAPTAPAASLIKGDTIASFNTHPPLIMDDNSIVIIDEISMVGKKTIEELDRKVRHIRPDNRKELFGGIQMVYFGDFAQLPPVNQENIIKSDQWKKVVDSYKLLTINHRADTKTFQGYLSEMRVGELSEDAKKYLNSRLISLEDSYKLNESVTRLYYDNKSINEFNVKKLNERSKALKKHIFTFNPRIHNSNHENKKLEYIQQNDTELKPFSICILATVIFTKNYDKKNGAFNTAKGIVIYIDKENNEITVRLNSNDIEIKVRPIRLYRKYENGKCDNDEESDYCMCETPIEKDKKCIECMKLIDKIDSCENDYYEVWNFPISLGWATSIHKAQGQTIDKELCVVLPKNSPRPSLLYVAFSRVTNQNNLHISLSPECNEIKFDQIKPCDDVKNIVIFGLECRVCKKFTHNKKNLCKSCKFVPFDQPLSFKDFSSRDESYKQSIIKNANTKKHTEEKWSKFLDAWNIFID